MPQHFRSQPFRTPQPSSSSFLPENLRTSLLKQIEYYFSVENLCKDIYLRRMMDEQGWVPVSLIASFKRVKMITGDVQCILDVLRSSTVVELMGDRIRKREDWERWVLIPQEDQQMESLHLGTKRLRIN
ncbi:hypothetical protein HPP92_025608 [Vanilla planifolia]|uniref:HTH La-type RNA-binding domain-containing protein n=1 Tax=Vanilla planifolia TaxID=51239 RepID=A0A835PMA8_VANPL|nr:hypothetical protein HPP92_025608 [Vanilla planifolia]